MRAALVGAPTQTSPHVSELVDVPQVEPQVCRARFEGDSSEHWSSAGEAGDVEGEILKV